MEAGRALLQGRVRRPYACAVLRCALNRCGSTDSGNQTASFEREREYYGKPNSTLVHTIISHADTSHARKHVAYLSSLHTRWCETDTGEQASTYLLDVLRSYVAAAPQIPARRITVRPVVHAFKQFTIVLRIAHVHASSTDAVAIVGAHMDSASRLESLVPGSRGCTLTVGAG